MKISVNPAQIMEVEVNFIAENIRKHIVRDCKTREEKFQVAMDFIQAVNEEEFEFCTELYKSFDYVRQVKSNVGPIPVRLVSESAKDEFIQELEEKGFYLRRPPHKPLLYGDIQKIYAKFPFIKPYPLYIDLFGIKHRRIMKDGVVGSKYMIVLKQNSNKNFSARSTFRVNRSNLPTKDITKKTNRSSYAKTPVRLSEIYNLLASIDGTTLAEYNIFMRSSALGRKSLQRILATDGNPLAVKKLKVKDNFINANADILNARLKGIGLELQFFDDPDPMPDLYYANAKTLMTIHGYDIMCTYERKPIFKRLFEMFDMEMRQFDMLETYAGQKQDICWQKVFENEECKDMELTEDEKSLLMTTTKGAITLLDMVKAKGKKAVGQTKEKDAAPTVDEIPDEEEDAPIRRRRGRRKKAESTTEEDNEA